MRNNCELTSLHFGHAVLRLLAALAAPEQVPGRELGEEPLLRLLHYRNLAISLAIHETLSLLVIRHLASELRHKEHEYINKQDRKSDKAGRKEINGKQGMNKVRNEERRP
jgi:hypothetical protein